MQCRLFYELSYPLNIVHFQYLIVLVLFKPVLLTMKVINLIVSIASRHSCRGWPTYQGEAVLRPVHVWDCAEPDQDVRGGPDLAGPASRQWRHEYWRMLWVPSSVERDSVCVLYAGQGKRVFHWVSEMLSVEPNLLNFRTILDKTLDFQYIGRSYLFPASKN